MSSYDMEDFKLDCYRFNSIAGKSVEPTLQDLKRQLDLIQEELSETYAALEEKDFTKILDGYCDVLVTAFGLGQQLQNLSIDTNEACKDTADNNLSKFIWTGEDNEQFQEATTVVNNSLEYYKEAGVEVKSTYSSFDGCFVLKDSNNKIRKPFNFKSNDLSSYIPSSLKVFSDEKAI